MLNPLRLWWIRRRHDRIYGNPRAARPRAVNTPWTRRRYWSEVRRNILFALCAVALGVVAFWLIPR